MDIVSKILEELKPNVILSYGSMIGSEVGIYKITNNKRQAFEFQIDNKVLNQNLLSNDQRDKLKTLFYNEIWPSAGAVMEIDDLLDFIDSNYPPETPLEKQERVLDFFRSLCKYDGDAVEYQQNNTEAIWRKAYIENEFEFLFYLESLVESGYLHVQDRFPGIYAGVMLTVAGLNKLVSLDEKKRSKTCFVAMSFDLDLRDIYDKAIVPALVETGFVSLRIDDSTTSSETTINDAMMAAIKKSRFTIADFTRHKKGVYFEAGYALGRGQKVIYTCREDEIDDAHFDTRNYPHLVWKNADDLKKKLIDRIEAFIKA
ncbi:MAG TPA: hypothetical protein VI461_11770 [Chitinophagaceae bacterium]|nr:hypothetical protein [Chitinophagaceae bacterium]